MIPDTIADVLNSFFCVMIYLFMILTQIYVANSWVQLLFYERLFSYCKRITLDDKGTLNIRNRRIAFSTCTSSK